jgi:uncharacterized membrane protein
MMVGRLLHEWERIRSSLWFVPAMMALCAMSLAFAMLALDDHAAGRYLTDIAWIHSRTAAGARDLLSVVAGSMITIAGLTFSIVIVALQLASVQLGPRLLRSFMRDTGNQLVLGTFIATFLYCLIVMRTINEGGPASPRLSVVVALLLAIISLAVLIYFIHHTATSIQAPVVVGRVARELDRTIDHLYPEALGGDAARESRERPPRADLSTAVESPRSGYLQRVDSRALMRAATRCDVLVRLCLQPGDFVVKGQPLALVTPADRCDDGLVRALHRSCIVGSQRSAEQDVDFVMSWLVEIALRALSSSRNDVFTAITCIHYQSAALVRLAGRRFPSPVRCGPDGRPRIIAPGPDLARLICRAFDDIVALDVRWPSMNAACLSAFAQIRDAIADDDLRSIHAIERYSATIQSRVPEHDSGVHRTSAPSPMTPATTMK